MKEKSTTGTIEEKYKAKENTSRHNPKKKQKQTINHKLVWTWSPSII
jgi:hypothetical protein